ncbi:hypothetical protein FXV83_20980 [Bradyrhizobium hipponense]|uniref:Uncharacterized protein n=1 Tax=Bradyrhizobium hipponense TaxID=2605638 RepID=A0A5S4YLT6_9BRAD|nr:hypothetical protein [Bradyrhizobium hipponense]TYO64604.1 hypothetical protein FXV83_20980 [Bradyrhizobium hipponense]
MLGLLILIAVLGLGFAIGYGTRGVVSRKRRAELLAYAPYLPPPNVQRTESNADGAARQPAASVKTTVAMLADRLMFVIALDFVVVLLVILLLPRPS